MTSTGNTHSIYEMIESRIIVEPKMSRTKFPQDKWDIDTMMETVRNIGRRLNPGFVLDESNTDVYRNLIYWLVADESMTSINPGNGSRIAGRLDKGIYLAGNTGSGKTLAMTIIRKLYPLFPFVDAEGVKVKWLEKRADEITEIYARSGEIQQFKQSPLLCIQDLGCEPNEASFMGNKLNVLQNIIEYRGDQPNKVTVVTSNIPLGHSDIASRYGERAQSRMVEMMNYLILTGKDRRYNIETK